MVICVKAHPTIGDVVITVFAFDVVKEFFQRAANIAYVWVGKFENVFAQISGGLGGGVAGGAIVSDYIYRDFILGVVHCANRFDKAPDYVAFVSRGYVKGIMLLFRGGGVAFI